MSSAGGHMPGIAETLAQSIAGKDWERLGELLDPELDFCAMTPKRVWDGGRDGALRAVATWFGDGDEIERVEHLETDAFADRERVGYRLAVVRDGAPYVVEQQAYLSARDGRVVWLRVMCSGYRSIA